MHMYKDMLTVMQGYVGKHNIVVRSQGNRQVEFDERIIMMKRLNGTITGQIKFCLLQKI